MKPLFPGRRSRPVTPPRMDCTACTRHDQPAVQIVLCERGVCRRPTPPPPCGGPPPLKLLTQRQGRFSHRRRRGTGIAAAKLFPAACTRHDQPAVQIVPCERGVCRRPTPPPPCGSPPPLKLLTQRQGRFSRAADALFPWRTVCAATGPCCPLPDALPGAGYGGQAMLVPTGVERADVGILRDSSSSAPTGWERGSGRRGRRPLRAWKGPM